MDQTNQHPQPWDPPGGDISLDELFPNPELAVPQVSALDAQPVPQATPAEPFLKASTGTVYNTLEDAVRGTEEKDRVIEQQKQELARVRAQQQPRPQTQQQSAQPDFAEQAFDRLAEAAQKGDKRGYIQALAEVQMATLSPLAGIIEEVAQERAIRSVGNNADGFRHFIGSDEFGKTLERLPLLKNAIDVAKTNPVNGAGQLPELYQLAYNSFVATKTNEITRNAVQTPAAPTPSRPTLTPSTPTPVPSNQQTQMPYTREQILANRQARQDFIKRYREERGGALDMEFGRLGL